MDELDELKRRYFRQKSNPRLDTVHEVLEELVRDSEADYELDIESPEPSSVDLPEVPLSRWPSNPPSVIQIAKSPGSRPDIRLKEDALHAGRSQKFCPALDRVVEETSDDIVELSGSTLLRSENHCAPSGQALCTEWKKSPDTRQPAVSSVELGGQVLEAASAILGALSEIRLDSSVHETQPSVAVAS